MPRRDLIKLNGDSNYGLNVFDTVGRGCANNPGDVMVVQAMFRYLSELWSANPDLDKLPPYVSMRNSFQLQPDGTMNSKTVNAILVFQKFNWYSALNIDGKIHPAKYENRNITIGPGKKLMTITALHFELWMAEPGLDYTQAIARRFPNVAFWIR